MIDDTKFHFKPFFEGNTPVDPDTSAAPMKN